MTLKRVVLLLAAAILVEAVVFLILNRDLAYLSQPLSRLEAARPAEFHAVAGRALARPRLTRRHLERIAVVSEANGDAGLNLLALERLARNYPDEAGVQIRLGDALRRAGRFDEARVVFDRLLGVGHDQGAGERR